MPTPNNLIITPNKKKKSTLNFSDIKRADYEKKNKEEEEKKRRAKLVADAADPFFLTQNGNAAPRKTTANTVPTLDDLIPNTKKTTTTAPKTSGGVDKTGTPDDDIPNSKKTTTGTKKSGSVPMVQDNLPRILDIKDVNYIYDISKHQGDATLDALKASKRAPLLMEKYGKSIDAIYDDYLRATGKYDTAHPVKFNDIKRAEYSVKNAEKNNAVNFSDIKRAEYAPANEYKAKLPKYDEKYEDDFKKFYEYRYEKSDYMDWNDATGYQEPHWWKVREEIAKKNGWTLDEFDEKYGAYENYLHTKQNLDAAIGSEKFGQEYPILATLFSFALTPQTMIEGAATSVETLLGEDNVKALRSNEGNYANYNTYAKEFGLPGVQQKEGMRAGASSTIDSEFGKGVYDVGTNLGDMAVSYALGGGTPVGMGVTSGTTAAAQNYQSAIDRGVDPTRAGWYGTATGAIGGILAGVGLDKVLGAPAKSALGSVLQATLTEGLEEYVEEGADKIADIIINQDKSEMFSNYNLYRSQGMSDNDAWVQVAKDIGIDLAQAGITGAIFGGVLRGAVVGTAEIAPRVEAFAAEKFAEHEAYKDPVVRDIVKGKYTNTEPAVDTTTQVDQSTADRLIADATQKANAAKQNIDELASQIPVAPETDVQNTEIPAVKPPMSEAEMADLQNELAEDLGWGERYDQIMAQEKAEQNAPVVEETAPAEVKSEDIKLVRNKETGEYTYEDYRVVKTGKSGYDVLDANGNSLGNARTLNDAKSTIANAQNGVALDNTGIDTNPTITEPVGESAPKPQETPVNQMPEVVNEEVTQPIQPAQEAEVTQDITQPETEVETVERDVPPEDNRKVSKLAPNTMRASDVVTEYEFENDQEVQDILKYEAHQNATTVQSAIDNVKQNHDTILNDYLSNKKPIDSDQDVHQAMLLLKELAEKARAGDMSASAKRKLLLARVRRQATKWGQDIQAFKVWNDTADGALINGDKIKIDRTKAWESRNQDSVKKNKKVAEDIAKIPATVEYDGTKISNGANYKGNKVNPNQSNVKVDNALKMQGNDGTMNVPKDPKTMEQIRREVRNSLAKEYGNVNKQFSDSDIDYLSNLVAEGATTAEIAEALNTKMATKSFGISAETQAKVNELFDHASQYDPNSIEAARAKAAAYKLIADEVVGDATAVEKFEAWRYLAMLGNPKTMIRNFVGNMTFNVLTGVSNSFASIVEAGTDYSVRGAKKVSNKLFGTDFDTSHGIERRKSLLLPTKNDKALVEGAWKDSVSHRYNEMAGSKYNESVKNKIRDAKSVFNSKWARLYEKCTDAGISDMLAVRTKYSTSLAGYMKANDMDASMFDADNRFRQLERKSLTEVLTDEERMELDDLRSVHEDLEKARDYAVKQAEYATFHEDNEFASKLSKHTTDWRNSHNPVAKGAGYILEGVMPFKKTPANIVRSGYEYSPFGAISSIAKTGKLIYENTGKRRSGLSDTYTTKSGKQVNRTLASDVIESWSKTLTGTGLMMLGMYLRNKGILNSSNTNEQYQDELEGKQNYSITINGHTYTIDWAAPASMSLLMGAELSKIFEMNAIPDKTVIENIGDVAGIVNTLVDPIVETSMMQGVKDTLTSAANITRYDDMADAGLGILGTMTSTALTNYLTQSVPTILGQAARVVDPTRRSTDTESDNWFGSGFEKQLRKVMNRVPGLSYLNQPYVNARGETELNSPSANPLISIPYQFMSPGYLDEINQTAADRSARKVYNSLVPGKDGETLVPQMDKGVYESWKSKVKVGDHKFTPEEMYQYRTISGQANEKIRTELAKADWFNELSPQRQNELLKQVNTFVDKLGKDSLGYAQDDKALDVYKAGGENAIPDLLNYYKENSLKKEVADQLGMKTNSKAVEEIVNDMMEGKTTAANRKMNTAENAAKAVEPYKEPAEELGIDATTLSQVANYAGSSWSSVEPELPVLKGMGGSNYSQYAHAVNYANTHDENISTQWFYDQTKKLDTDKSGGVSQDELIDFFNANNMSENDVNRWWGMFALGQNGAEPKNKPHKITRGKNKGKWGR